MGNVISLNGMRLDVEVDEDRANYTVYEDGSIQLKQRGVALYGRSARKLGIDIRHISTESEMRDLQHRAWELMVSEAQAMRELAKNERSALSQLLAFGHDGASA